MKTIRLKKLSLHNFKGIKSLDIDFDKDLTAIYGDNATGKTTIFDAFTWLLFGKDHNDKSVFEIKTLDSNNKAIPKLQHEVEAVLLVDNETITIKRCYKEKWVKQRGSLEAVLTGHETTYYYDEVPVTLTEFGEKITEIVKEQAFKLFTNPLYFNSLAWTKRRTILEELITPLSDADIIKSNDEFGKLLDEMAGKSFDDFKRIINSKKKAIKSELDEIPTRIDELFKSLPEIENWEELESQVLIKTDETDSLVEQIIDSSKVDEAHSELISKKQKEVVGLEFEKSRMVDLELKEFSKRETAFNITVNELDSDVQLLDFELSKFNKRIDNGVTERQRLESKIVKLRIDFDTKQAEVFQIDSQFNCPTCKRGFEQVDIEIKKKEMNDNFNVEKVKALDVINLEGKELKSLMKTSVSVIKTSELEKGKIVEKLVLLRKQLSDLKSIPVKTVDESLDNEAYKDCIKKLELTQNDLEDLRNKPIEKNEELIKTLESKRIVLKLEIDGLNLRLFKKQQIKDGQARIEKLEKSSSLLAHEIAEFERKEFLIEKFTTQKMNHLEKSVNDLFPTVQFKLFSVQLNGGIAECCDTLIDGVPFFDANNAAKIQSGIEIINVLTEHFNCNAPIFVDNAESIVKLPHTNAQLITLVVSKNHKSLTVN